jgi:hypothetical protein
MEGVIFLFSYPMFFHIILIKDYKGVNLKFQNFNCPFYRYNQKTMKF